MSVKSFENWTWLTARERVKVKSVEKQTFVGMFRHFKTFHFPHPGSPRMNNFVSQPASTRILRTFSCYSFVRRYSKKINSWPHRKQWVSPRPRVTKHCFWLFSKDWLTIFHVLLYSVLWNFQTSLRHKETLAQNSGLLSPFCTTTSCPPSREYCSRSGIRSTDTDIDCARKTPSLHRNRPRKNGFTAKRNQACYQALGELQRNKLPVRFG